MLRAVQPFTPEDVIARTVRGQYDVGELSDGTTAPAYRHEPTASPPTPPTETYVALKLLDRQLALGRRAVLPAHRQAHANAA